MENQNPWERSRIWTRNTTDKYLYFEIGFWKSIFFILPSNYRRTLLHLRIELDSTRMIRRVFVSSFARNWTYPILKAYFLSESVYDCRHPWKSFKSASRASKERERRKSKDWLLNIIVIGVRPFRVFFCCKNVAYDWLLSVELKLSLKENQMNINKCVEQFKTIEYFSTFFLSSLVNLNRWPMSLFLYFIVFLDYPIGCWQLEERCRKQHFKL